MAEKQNAQQETQSQPTEADDMAQNEQEAQADNVAATDKSVATKAPNAAPTDAKPNPQAASASKASTKPATSSSAAATKAQPPMKKPANGIAWLAFLLSLGCAGALGAGYWYWQQIQLMRADEILRQQTLIDQQSSKVQILEQQLTEQFNIQQAQLAELQNSLAQQQTQLVAQQQSINATLNDNVEARLKTIDHKMAELNSQQPNDWILAEAKYLINIAERKLHLEHDKDSAKMLLSTALRQVASLGDYSLTPLTDAIAADIAQVEALKDSRIDDYYLQLSGEIAKIDLMRINNDVIYPKQGVEQTIQAQGEGQTTTDWQQHFMAKITGGLKKMFYFDYGAVDTELKHQFNAQEQWYLRANLRLALMQAQSAIMQRKTLVFKNALEQALLQLAQFNPQDSNVVSATQAVRTMLSESVDSQYPERFNSRLLLSELIVKRLGQQAGQLPDSEGAQQ